MREIVLVGAQVLNGVLAGVYVAFLVAVMPALHDQPDEVFVRVMNRINVVIVNPAFLALFVGAPLTAMVALRWQSGPVGIVAAALAFAALMITIAANVPLNNALAGAGSRAAFEAPWLVWHAVRTAASLGAAVLLMLPG